VLLLIVIIALALVILPVNVNADRVFLWLTVLTVIGAIVGAYVLAIRSGMQHAKRGMVFVLMDKEIIRKRDGWPDDKIAFAEINALYDGPDALVIESTDPVRRIYVPKEVNRLAEIRTELAEHHPFSTQARPPRAKLSGTGLVLLIVNILSWIAIVVIFYKATRPR